MSDMSDIETLESENTNLRRETEELKVRVDWLEEDLRRESSECQRLRNFWYSNVRPKHENEVPF